MDLNLTREESTFRDEFRAWLVANVPKDWNSWREKPLEESFPYLRTWQRKLHEGGWAAVSWPKEYGGRGASFDGTSDFHGRDGASRSSADGERLGPWIDWTYDHRLRDRRAEKAIHPQNSERRRDLVPGILGAECRLRPRRRADRSRARRRSLTSSTGRKSGPVTAGRATGANWWYARIANAAKHKGLTVLLVDMKSPGVEVRPLRQMTGESEFNELFFRDVRVPVENVLGKVNDGWNVALSTLMHERGSYGAPPAADFQAQYQPTDRTAHALRPATAGLQRTIPLSGRNWRNAYAEIEIMRLNQLRAFSRITETGVPGPEGSIQKIFWSELNQRFQQIAQEIDGALRAATRKDPQAIDEGRVVVRVPAHARQHHRGRHVGNPAQHHRAFRARIAKKLLRRNNGISD